MTSKKKRVVIYLPDGKTRSYILKSAEAAKEAGDILVDTIECDPRIVNIAWVDADGTAEGEVFYGMPYYLNMW